MEKSNNTDEEYRSGRMQKNKSVECRIDEESRSVIEEGIQNKEHLDEKYVL